MGNCPDCGGSGGNHYNDCSYDGTGGGTRLGIWFADSRRARDPAGIAISDIGTDYDCCFYVEGDHVVGGKDFAVIVRECGS